MARARDAVSPAWDTLAPGPGRDALAVPAADPLSATYGAPSADGYGSGADALAAGYGTDALAAGDTATGDPLAAPVLGDTFDDSLTAYGDATAAGDQGIRRTPGRRAPRPGPVQPRTATGEESAADAAAASRTGRVDPGRQPRRGGPTPSPRRAAGPGTRGSATGRTGSGRAPGPTGRPGPGSGAGRTGRPGGSSRAGAAGSSGAGSGGAGSAAGPMSGGRQRAGESTYGGGRTGAGTTYGGTGTGAAYGGTGAGTPYDEPSAGAAGPYGGTGAGAPDGGSVAGTGGRRAGGGGSAAGERRRTWADLGEIGAQGSPGGGRTPGSGQSPRDASGARGQGPGWAPPPWANRSSRPSGTVPWARGSDWDDFFAGMGGTSSGGSGKQLSGAEVARALLEAFRRSLRNR